MKPVGFYENTSQLRFHSDFQPAQQTFPFGFGAKKDRGTGFSVLAAREMKQEPKNESGAPPRSFTCAIFRSVFDSRSSFFAPKPPTETLVTQAITFYDKLFCLQRYSNQLLLHFRKKKPTSTSKVADAFRRPSVLIETPVLKLQEKRERHRLRASLPPSNQVMKEQQAEIKCVKLKPVCSEYLNHILFKIIACYRLLSIVIDFC